MSEKVYDIAEHLEGVEGDIMVVPYTPRVYARDDAIKAIMNLLGIFNGIEATLLIDGKKYLEVRANK